MRRFNLAAHFFLIATLFGFCLGRPASRSLQVEDARKRDSYCDAFDRTVRSFGFHPDARSVVLREDRSLPFFLDTLGYYPLRWKAETLFEDNKVESYKELLSDMVVTFKETHKRLLNCGNCLDDFIGKVFVEYLPGYAVHPSVTLTDNEFAQRTIEFLGELGDELERRLKDDPPKDTVDFGTFYDYLYRSVNTVFRDDDFGGLVSLRNIFHLLDLGSVPYVKKAIESDGRQIYKEWLKCGDDSSLPAATTVTPTTSKMTTKTMVPTTTVKATAKTTVPRTTNAASTTAVRTTIATTTTTPTTTAKPDPYCEALVRWSNAFAPQRKARSMRTPRSLPWFFWFGKGTAKGKLETAFENAHIKDFNGLLKDSILVLKETHKRLVENCNHCIDHFIGTILQEYITGRGATNPASSLNEEEFTTRLIEFIGQLGDELQRRVDESPPSANMDFDDFWDYFYDSIDAVWQGGSDFGGFLTISTATGLGDLFSKQYVKDAIAQEGPEIVEKYLKCKMN